VRKLGEYRACIKDKIGGGAGVLFGIDDIVVDNLNDIIVTHMHGDHSAGLEDIGWYKMFIQDRPIFDRKTNKPIPSRRPNVYGTAGVIEDLVARVDATLTRASGMPPDAFYNFVPIEHSGLIFSVGLDPVKVDVIPTYHGLGPGRSFAIKLTYQDRVVSYSGDTRFDSNLIEELSHADLIVHECDVNGFVHTTPDDLVRWAGNNPEAASRLYVCHYPAANIPLERGLRPLEVPGFIDVIKAR